MAPRQRRGRDRLWLILPGAAVLLYLALTLPQLGLPGLHYDEAKEAGVNAMEMLLRQDVHAFRAAGVQLGDLFLPLMVQDYIGALGVYLALPFLAALGITVPALRLAAVCAGLVTLVVVRLLGNTLSGPRSVGKDDQTPTSSDIAQPSDGSSGHGGQARPADPLKADRAQGHAGDVAILLLAVSPTFIFWSRQGIFVTNVVVTLAVAAVWAAVRWRQSGRPAFLYLFAVLAGLGLWSKLLFVWVLGALVGVVIVEGLWHLLGKRRQGLPARRTFRGGTQLRDVLIAGALFLLTIAPLLLFNQQTGGTFDSILGNLGSSYYGVQNAAFLANVQVRLGQVLTLLRGDHFWYLGAILANRLAPWIAAALVLAALALNRPGRAVLLRAALFVALLVLQSAFTISDLFITHFAILQPFVILLVALAAEQLIRWAAGSGRHRAVPTDGPLRKRNERIAATVGLLAAVSLVLWVATDLGVNIRYHQALAASGGHASHSDASRQLADWLDEQDLSQPLALDWGIEAPVRFLAANRVQPLELFGYEQLDRPDPGFAARLEPFLADPARRYLLHAPEDTVFKGRLQALETLAESQGKSVIEEAIFPERSGRPLFVVVRVE